MKIVPLVPSEMLQPPPPTTPVPTAAAALSPAPPTTGVPSQRPVFAAASAVSVPVIASGGCGSPEHIRDVFQAEAADAALAASIFHYGEYTVRDVKEYLKEEGVSVRL